MAAGGLVAMAMFAAMPAAAQAAGASAVGSASATVVAPIAVRQLADLDFGIVASEGMTNGQVVLVPGGHGADYGGDARQACGVEFGCPAPHAARFAVTGEPNRAYAISAPQFLHIAGQPAASNEGAVAEGQAPALRVDGIRFRSDSRPGMGPSGQLDLAGADSFDLGGTLHVPGPLPAARYRVTLSVIVTYS